MTCGNMNWMIGSYNFTAGCTSSHSIGWYCSHNVMGTIKFFSFVIENLRQCIKSYLSDACAKNGIFCPLILWQSFSWLQGILLRPNGL